MQLKTLMTENNTVIVRSDKSPHLCYMNKETITLLATKHLQDDNTYTHITESDYNSINSEVVNQLQQLKLQFPPFQNKKIIPSSVQNRLFKILLKLHKEPQHWYEFPTLPKSRPIVSDCASTTSMAAKIILPFLQDIERKLPTVSTSSLQVAYKLQQLNKYHFGCDITMATADVESMYTNININKVIDILQTREYNIPHKTTFLKILSLLMNNTTFQYDKSCYKQIRGLAMGSPISGSIANIYLGHYEKIIIEKNNQRILLYTRYIDDILIIAKSTTQIMETIQDLQSITSLNITPELSKQRVTYLDLSITFSAWHNLLIYPYYKFAAPIRRAFLPVRRESRVLIGQFLRIWRLTNNADYITFQIELSIQYLRTQNISQICINDIRQFLKPVKTQTHYSHEHLLCQECQSITQTKQIQILKIVTYKNKIVASRQPCNCQIPSNILLIQQNTSEFTMSPPTTIHTFLNKKEITTGIKILPLGQLSPEKLKILLNTMKWNLPDKTIPAQSNPYPPYIHSIFTNPKEVYGTKTAEKRKRNFVDFMKHTSIVENK
jgi:hypothetical protein